MNCATHSRRPIGRTDPLSRGVNASSILAESLQLGLGFRIIDRIRIQIRIRVTESACQYMYPALELVELGTVVYHSIDTM